MLSALASAASKAGAHAGGAAQQASGGLPQLNVPDYAPQLIWLAGIFVALYLVMSKWIIPNVGSVLQERADRNGKDLGEAQRLKAETAKALANYEQALSEAKAGAQKIVGENRAVLNAEINKERALVEARIATLQRQRVSECPHDLFHGLRIRPHVVLQVSAAQSCAAVKLLPGLIVGFQLAIDG